MTIRKFYDFDGLGGGIDPKSSVKSDMTKEQIIQKHYPFYDENLTIKDVELNGEQCQALMKEYAQQQLSAERERAGKMVEALKVIAEKVGYIWVREDILKLIENYNAHEINS